MNILDHSLYEFYFDFIRSAYKVPHWRLNLVCNMLNSLNPIRHNMRVV
jgi:hypothetical protein